MTDLAIQSPTTVFLVDNGAAYCGRHLGASARMTGRDLSGQPILAVTGDVLAEARAEGWVPHCETCGLYAGEVK